MWIVGTWGWVTTHKGFLQQQTANQEHRTAEEELAEMKAKMVAAWEEVRDTQHAAVQAWRKEKQQLVLLKKKLTKKPSEWLMKDWTAKFFPDVVARLQAASKSIEGNWDDGIYIEA